MLEIAFGMKQVHNDSTEHPIVAMMANDFASNRDGMTEDEFMTNLARFALAVSAMAVAQTVQLCLSDEQQEQLALTIEELNEMENLGKE